MKKVLAVTLAAGALAVQTACTTINPYTGEKETAKAASGAAIGAAVGALVGIATSDNARERKERALKGAGIGALAGGGVGYYMDVQEAKLRQKLEGTGVSVTREGDSITLNMPGNITFATDSSRVQESFKPVLDSVAEVLKEYEKTMIQIAGHTDATGSERYNMLLSKDRARAVGDVLAEFGVQPVRMDMVGFGETRPIATNSTDTGRARNRRVELTLIPYVEE